MASYCKFLAFVPPNQWVNGCFQWLYSNSFLKRSAIFAEKKYVPEHTCAYPFH